CSPFRPPLKLASLRRDLTQGLDVVAARTYLARVLARLNGQFGQGPVLAASLVLLLCVVASLVAFGFFDTAAPSTLTITSGPEGSGFKRNAEQYKKILAKQGVTLKILPSEGSHDNLQRLANREGRGRRGLRAGRRGQQRHRGEPGVAG